MTLNSKYSVIFDDAFNYVQTNVSRRNLTPNYDWLLYKDYGFVPDYFKIRSIGKSVFQRFLNYTVSNRLNGFSPSYVVLKRFVVLFYQLPILAPYQDSFHWLLSRLKKAPSDMMNWTLVEFFWFMVVWSEKVEQNGFDFTLIKRQANQQCLDMVNKVIGKNIESWDMKALVHAACYANWLDVVVPDYQDREVATIQRLAEILQDDQYPLQLESFTSCLQGVSTIMYECDNAGEVIFDLLVIMRLIASGKRVIIVAKYAPILNDVTVDEIYDLLSVQPLFQPLKLAMATSQCQLISANDFVSIGKYLPLVSEAYRNSYKNADLIWLKGQANFQTMPLINHDILTKKIKYRRKIALNFVAKAPIVQYCLRYSNIGKVNIGDPLFLLV